ncbi:hypothetical protein [Amycolatopsis sp. CA-128772]|uniref:hypothetical protein n=1 Tax=Amycolatopsis sp. CA-128772 TaxID=2073159 RepID=UPI000CD098F7|nr:hypothetical protein [Amycolatopsis sp. CA-128772]
MTNSASGRFSGPVLQVGTIRGDLHVGTPGPVRSHYLDRVESLAPPSLVDREDELAELARFCSSPDTEGAYAWWQADAWSGKSALLTTFVLNPPPGVRLVAFFITSSQPGQSDRRAFVDTVLEQLCAVHGTPLPPSTDSTREARLRGLLAEVAQDCRTRGEQFALVVDGLDEDLGRDGSPDAHSIAALLPVHPPAGMRVIVSGRSSPPLPTDVPDHHPLRSRAIIRPLAPSAKAGAVRDAKERDLKRLLRGSAAERDLLGLLTAAAGGLTPADLAELTGTSEWEIEDCLSTATGRSFARRPPERPGSADVLVLAHEQLLVTARAMLGARLAVYRQRLDEWAGEHAARGWPPDTPEYLVRGYFALLLADQDLPRMLACATDPRRHRLALVRVGGDGVALGEIRSTQNLVLAAAEPDLVALARLAVHRVHLLRGNSRVPPGLPSGWALLGRLDQAEAMIDAIRQPYDRIRALIATADVCGTEGNLRDAARLLDRAEELAAAFNQFWGAGPVVSLAWAAARAGDHDRARRVAALVRHPAERAETLAQLAAAEPPDRANSLLAEAGRLLEDTESHGRAQAWGAMAVAATGLDRPDDTGKWLENAETALSADRLARRTTFPGPVAAAAAKAGDDERALRILNSMEDAEKREGWLRSVIRITARRDSHRAEAIARTTAEPLVLSVRLAEVARSAGNDDPATANRLTDEALAIAQAEAEPVRRREALIAIASAIAETGDPQQAVTITREYAERGRDANAVFSVAAALLRNRKLDEGTEVLRLAERVARGLVGENDQRSSVLWIRTMADHGDFDRAERQAARLQDPTARASAWAVITEGAVAAGELDRAESALSRVADPAFEWRPRLDLIRAALAAGLPERARAVALKAHHPRDRAAAVLRVARETRDTDLLDEAGQLVAAFADPLDTMSGLLRMIAVTAGWGDRARTRNLIGRLEAVPQPVEEDLGPESGPVVKKARRVLELFSTRVRSLTEVGHEASGAGTLLGERRHNTATFEAPARYFGRRTRGLSPEEALLKELTEDDWAYVVEDLVDRCPEAYPAIVAELDALTAD